MKHEIKLLAASALLVASSAANAGIIDLFTTDQAELVDSIAIDGGAADGGVSSSVTTVGTDIVGGARDIFVELLDNGGFNGRDATIGVGGGVLDFSVDTLASGMGIVQWDGNDGSIGLDVDALGGGLGGLDFTESGTLNAFALDVLFADAGFNFVVEVYTDDDTWTKASLLSFSVASPATRNLFFSDFGNCGLVDIPSGILNIECGVGGAADFTNVGALQVMIDPLGGSTSIDLTLDNITTVPEPSVLALMGTGLLAGGFAARTRRNKKVNVTA